MGMPAAGEGAMFHFSSIRPLGSTDGAGLLPDLTGPGIDDLVPDPGDGTTRHGFPVSGFTVTVDRRRDHPGPRAG